MITEKDILKDTLLEQMKNLFLHYNINKVILFGSRARGDNKRNSDFDFVIFADEMSELERARFCLEVEDNDTLFKVDILFYNEDLDKKLKENIIREGQVIYERIRDKTS